MNMQSGGVWLRIHAWMSDSRHESRVTWMVKSAGQISARLLHARVSALDCGCIDGRAAYLSPSVSADVTYSLCWPSAPWNAATPCRENVPRQGLENDISPEAACGRDSKGVGSLKTIEANDGWTTAMRRRTQNMTFLCDFLARAAMR